MFCLGEHEKAVDIAMEALSVLPVEPTVHFNLANTLGKMKRYREAESHFKEAIRLKPNQAMYYVNLGKLWVYNKFYNFPYHMFWHNLFGCFFSSQIDFLK